MTKKLVRCPICDPWDGTVYAGWSLPRHGKQFFVEHHYCTGWVDCPLCEGSGNLSPELWSAYHLHVGEKKPTYDELIALRRKITKKTGKRPIRV